jgi:alpha-glucosidase
VIVNVSAAPVDLPPHDEILLSSGPVAGGVLAPDTTVWLRAREESTDSDQRE